MYYFSGLMFAFQIQKTYKYIYIQFHFGMLVIVRLCSFINFTTYDTKCMIFERS
jgi:hypothetical protein